LMARGAVDAREQLRSLQRRAERPRDLQECGRQAPLLRELLPAVFEAVRELPEGDVLSLQVRAVEEALLREEEEEKGREDRLDTARGGDRAPPLAEEQQLVAGGRGDRQEQPARDRDEARRDDDEREDRPEEERLEAAHREHDAERDPGQVREA